MQITLYSFDIFGILKISIGTLEVLRQHDIEGEEEIHTSTQANHG